MKKVCVLLLTILIIFTHSMAFAKERHVPKLDSDYASIYIITDILFIRPLGFVGFLGGSVLFIATLPVAVATKSIDRTKQAFILDTYAYTFNRPLGDLRGEENY